jgi:ABC-type glycerol-3-phosphate transport system permease component
MVTDKLAMRTLPIGLAYLKGTQEGGNQWNILMAAASLAALPLILLFLLTQKLILQEVQLIRKERLGN